MRKVAMLAAFAAALTASPALAKEKPDQPPGQPREKKVCRTVQMSGRITPQRICRKVERPAAEDESQRAPLRPDESGNRTD